MSFEGRAVQVLPVEGGFLELRFDLEGESVNKLDRATLEELEGALRAVEAARAAAPERARGLLITSAKAAFIVGADITEFLPLFSCGEAEIVSFLRQGQALFSSIEDLALPSVAAIGGLALGGGFELALAADYRVVSADARVGLPETRLGIIPGWGGTVRLARLAGADTAIEWIAGGEQHGATEALAAGAIDAIAAPAELRQVALVTLEQAATGRLDWRARRAVKRAPSRLDRTEAGLVFATGRAVVGAKALPHYPAPMAAIDAIEGAAGLDRDAALAVEAAAFGRVALTPAARALVSVFLSDQAVKRIAKHHARDARPVRRVAVVGAGIMGGGIAYQSAARGVAVLMKDIAPRALEQGLAEATKLLGKQVERGTLELPRLAATLAAITPTLSYGDFGTVDLAIEAVVENEPVKKTVLAEVEAALAPAALLASNTSTISIDRLASALKRPESFCGLHFFNPVPRMPLVEVIRGRATAPATIATAVAYAQAIGKTPVVVADGPGFLVNRVLFPYFAGFQRLLQEGADFERIDRVMERWGWPMGPAVLLDVIGIDTAVHAERVMAEAFPERLGLRRPTPIETLLEAQRRGQKNGRGFYAWRSEKKGPPSRQSDPDVRALLGVAHDGPSDEQIVERLMLPMLLEASRCLEESIVASAAEVDVALLYGLGFPPFRGGVFRWADATGTRVLLEATRRHQDLGALYAPTAQLTALAAAGRGFHGE